MPAAPMPPPLATTAGRRPSQSQPNFTEKAAFIGIVYKACSRPLRKIGLHSFNLFLPMETLAEKKTDTLDMQAGSNLPVKMEQGKPGE